MYYYDDYETIKSYLKEIRNYPVLGRAEEIELFKKLQAGDKQARQKIIQSNLRFVVKIALEFIGKGLALSDLIQEGNIGLMEVLGKFDHRKGYRFSTYAAFWIRQSIQLALKRKASFIRLPVRKSRLLGQITEAMNEFAVKNGRDPTLYELSDTTHVNVDMLKNLLKFKDLVRPLETKNDENQPFSLLNVISCDTAHSPLEQCIKKQRNTKVKDLLSFLTDKEAQVIRLRFGFEDGKHHSLRQASKIVGLSQEGVRRVEMRALGKLRRPSIKARLSGLL